MATYPRQLTDDNVSIPLPIENKTQLFTKNDMINITYVDVWRCNRSISIRVQMNNNILKSLCLCPPNYYGDECQFQNQLVSLTVQIRATSDWRIVYLFYSLLL